MRLESARLRSAALQRRLDAWEAMAPRPPDNAEWVDARRAAEQARSGSAADEDSDVVKQQLLRDPAQRFPLGHNTSAWAREVDARTPSAFREAGGSGAALCDPSQALLSAAQLAPGAFGDAEAAAALRALRECGFVLLDDFFSAEATDALRAAYTLFRDDASGGAAPFRYPVQGAGRVEHMLPFAPPFNATRGAASFHHDPRLLRILRAFLGDGLKLELMTVIESTAGSADQRWHQGWRYLFHPEERLPPAALIVAVPLVDVNLEMGPTEICAGHNLRFYRGWRCPEPVSASTTRGTAILFDYKTLHRGPANRHPSLSRPMLSMVFSKLWFVNTEAMLNRGITLQQTLHQRRYWEQFLWHPPTADAQFVV